MLDFKSEIALCECIKNTNEKKCYFLLMQLIERVAGCVRYL